MAHTIAFNVHMVTHFSPGGLVCLRFVTLQNIKAVPGEIHHRVSTVSYLLIVGGRSKQISASHLRFRDPKTVPVELSWEMAELAVPAPTPGPLFEPPPIADLPPPASPAPETSTDPTPEAPHRAPSAMALAHTPVRPCTASPRVSAPRSASSNSMPLATPLTTFSGRQVIKPQCPDFVYFSRLKRVAWPPPPEDQDIVESEPIYSKGPAYSDQFGPAPIQAAQPSYPTYSAPSAQPPQSYKPSKVASPPLLAYQPPPATITLRAEPPIHQEQAPVFSSQPAATKGLGPKMRGDEKWPPATVKAQSAAENEARKALAKGPAFRPRKVKKDYSNFFAQNALNPNYPGYRAPPGTQHYTEEGTSDL
uniref:Uncharacterized protein n=2 Tax=Timema TaxID=61471 RepID=A0A7R9K8R0_TIMGE|nr:unnamed protein product [Timema genevievae]